jgi:uncharacterized protein (DUF2141 family)
MRLRNIPGLAFFVIAIVLLVRCAQVIPLSGGARDTAPPVLVSVTPAGKSTNLPVKGLKIVFKFNELVAVQNLSQKLIINPQLEEMPEVTASGKTLTVSFEKPLLPNTTYFIQFGNSVVDIHESNPHPNLSYLFSTGPTIDSSYVTGKCTYALTGKPASDLLVMLYTDLRDSAPMVSGPDYITRTGPEGRYFLSAIRPGRYRVMAVGDKNKNQQYDPGEAFGFVARPVELVSDTFNLKISTEESSKLFIKKKLQAFWGYNKYVLSDTFPYAYIITEKAIDTDRYQYEMRNDTLEVYYRELYERSFEFVVKEDKQSFDTVRLEVPGRAEVDSSVAKGTRRLSLRTEKARYGSRHDEVVLDFSVPLEQVIAEKCLLLRDSVREQAVLTSERANDEGRLVTTFHPLYKKRLAGKLQPGRKYQLVLLPGALKTYWGTANRDTLRTSFTTYPADELSSLQVKLSLPPDIKTYVLQLLNSKEQVVATRAAAVNESNSLPFYNLVAGDYMLRLIDDRDQDQKFSPASYVNKQQPERVFFYEKKIAVPAGWDVEAEWKVAPADMK